MPTLTAELIADFEHIGDPRVSPNGKLVAYVVEPSSRRGDRDVAHVWVAPVDGSSEPVQWTRAVSANRSPRWSPDGTRLAFLSDRIEKGTMALHLMDARGGEAKDLALETGSISSFKWSPDGRHIAFIAPDKKSAEDERRAIEKDDADVWGEAQKYGWVWLVDVDAPEPSAVPLIDGDRHAHDVTWSPDGASLAVIIRDSPDLDRVSAGPGWIVTVSPDADSADERMIASGAGPMMGLAWSQDGQWLGFLGPTGDVPQSSQALYRLRVAGGQPERVFGGDTFCATDLRAAQGSGRLVVEAYEGLDTRLEWLDIASGQTRLLYSHSEGDCASVWAVYDPPKPASRSTSATRSPFLIAGISGPNHPRDLFAVLGIPFATSHSPSARPPATPVASSVDRPAPSLPIQLTHHNASLRSVSFGKQSDFFWTSSDGIELDGILIEPASRRMSRPFATIVLVHGGPYGRSGRGLQLTWAAWGQWLAELGYAVLLPNYRGGAGHGEAFAADARGGTGGHDWSDCESMVDAAIERGIADPGRLGIGGWSQGGFMTAWAVSHTDRFRAAIMGAGVSDWGMMSAGSDLPEFESILGGSRPWDGVGPHRHSETSPISHARNAKTPTLILHGERDARVPLAQAWGFHRALRDAGCPVEMIVYPREPHGLRERNHQIDVLNRVRDWFSRYIEP